MLQRQHGRIEIREKAVLETGVVPQAPLAARMAIGPRVALAREIDPLGMSELVAHKSEPRVAAKGHCDKPDHLVEGDTTGNDGRLLHQRAHVRIHLGVHKNERYSRRRIVSIERRDVCAKQELQIGIW